MRECPECHRTDGIGCRGIWNDGGKMKEFFECLNHEPVHKWDIEVPDALNNWKEQG